MPGKWRWGDTSVFTKILEHNRHFHRLGPNVWWEISQIWIEFIKPIGQMSDELWKFSATLLPGPWFKIKALYYQYRKSHCGDKTFSGLILGFYPANERQHYFVTTSLIGWGASLKSALNLTVLLPPQWDFLYWQDDIFILNQPPSLIQ